MDRGSHRWRFLGVWILGKVELSLFKRTRIHLDFFVARNKSRKVTAYDKVANSTVPFFRKTVCFFPSWKYPPPKKSDVFLETLATCVHEHVKELWEENHVKYLRFSYLWDFIGPCLPGSLEFTCKFGLRGFRNFLRRENTRWWLVWWFLICYFMFIP